MKVYLAKSNKSNPDTVMQARQILQKLDCQIVEFQGGKYTNRDLIDSDMLLVIPETFISTSEARIGKGLHTQIEDFRLTNKLDKAFVISVVIPGTLGINHIIRVEESPNSNYVNFGKVHFNEDVEQVTKHIQRKEEDFI